MTNPFFSFKLSEIIKASMYTASPIIRLLGFPITFTPNLTFFPLVLLKNMSCNSLQSVYCHSLYLSHCMYCLLSSFHKNSGQFFSTYFSHTCSIHSITYLYYTCFPTINIHTKVYLKFIFLIGSLAIRSIFLVSLSFGI